MPTVTVGDASIEVAHGTRLVLALEHLGIDVGHRCGGKARCTTCRVEFHAGEPDAITVAEAAKLVDKEMLGTYRLSCQVLVDRDMTVVPTMTLQSEGWTDTGAAPSETLEPDPEWTTMAQVTAG